MSRALELSIATPDEQVVHAVDVRSVRASDASGSFGILPGHADLLTVLPPSVVRWREADGVEHYCAVREGVFSMTGGTRVGIACRQAIRGERLADLEREVAAAREAVSDADRRARSEQVKLHARAVRQIMRYLVPSGGSADDIFPGEGR